MISISIIYYYIDKYRMQSNSEYDYGCEMKPRKVDPRLNLWPKLRNETI